MGDYRHKFLGVEYCSEYFFENYWSLWIYKEFIVLFNERGKKDNISTRINRLLSAN